jgi:PhnB protein
MQNSEIPGSEFHKEAGHMQVNTHLTFDGRCEEAFRFYARSLGGKIQFMMPHEGSPAAGAVPQEWGKKILHATLQVGDQTLMGADAPPGSYQPPQGFSVALHIPEPAEAERVFGALAEGGKVNMPIQETFWAHKFGMLVDRFGTPWMVNCAKPM